MSWQQQPESVDLTLSLLERGETVTVTTLIQVLRVLDQLSVLHVFEVRENHTFHWHWQICKNKNANGHEVYQGKDEEQAVSEILKIGTSAGGARPKALIAWNENTGEVKSEQNQSTKGIRGIGFNKLDGVSDV